MIIIIYTHIGESSLVVLCQLHTHFLCLRLTRLLYPHTPFSLYHRMPRVPHFTWQTTLVVLLGQHWTEGLQTVIKVCIREKYTSIEKVGFTCKGQNAVQINRKTRSRYKEKLKARTQNGAFWRYLRRFLGSWNCWEKLEAGRKNGAFWRYLKRCFGSWNCLDNFESKQAKWYIRTLFEECGRRLSGELLNVEICSSLK